MNGKILRMSSQLISNTIRSSNIRRIITSVIIALIVLGVGLFNIRYIANFFAGPRDIDHSELLQIDNADKVSRNWVNVKADQTIDTGYQMVETSRTGRETVESNYLALVIDDRILLVESPSADEVTEVSGALIPISDEIRSKVITELEQEADLQDVFLPYMLDAGNFRMPGYIGMGIGGIILLFCAWGVFMGVMQTDVSRHPIMRRLSRFGDPTMTVSEIENELLAPRWQHDKLRITTSWLVYTVAADFSAMRLNELVWMYKQVTQRRVNGIPAGKTFTAIFCDSHGQQIVVQGKNEQDVEEILTQVHGFAPWALAGYNNDIEKAWKKDRAALIEAVAQRRAQPQQPQTEA